MIPEIDAQLTELGKIKIGKLGSCQYYNIEVFYNWALASLKHNRKGFEEAYGITYKCEPNDEQEFIRHLKGELQNHWDFEYYGKLPQIKTIEDYYKTCRESSWDLWSAVESPLIGLEINQKIYNSESFDYAIKMAYTSLLYGTPIEAFADFDT
jgi:hypothetical protein